jgi:predicted RNase H-like HicB family nuclease
MGKKYYKVVFEPQEEGGYTVTVPSLPGCISEGDTYDEALANIKEAIALYLESLQADGLPIPDDKIGNQWWVRRKLIDQWLDESAYLTPQSFEKMLKQSREAAEKIGIVGPKEADVLISKVRKERRNKGKR